MWVAPIKDVWDFVFNERFPVVINRKRFEVKKGEYVPDGWRGYIYISSEREGIYCFDTFSSLMNTLQVISEQ